MKTEKKFMFNPVNGSDPYQLNNQFDQFPGNSAGDLFGMVKWPFQRATRDLQRESKGHFESLGLVVFQSSRL